MPSRRAQKAAAAVREVVSMAILAELRDPRVKDVTVTYVEVSGDLRIAKVHVSVMGDERKQQLSLYGLKSSAGYLQSKVAKRLDLRYTPRLTFILDQGVKRSIEISKILKEVLPSEEDDDAMPEEGVSADNMTAAKTTGEDVAGKRQEGADMLNDMSSQTTKEEKPL